MLPLRHCLHVQQIRFVSYQRHDGLFLRFELLLHEAQPVLDVLETLLVRDIVGEETCIGLVDVGGDHFTENALASDVPQLQGN